MTSSASLAPALELISVRKAYNSFVAVQDLSLSIASGTIFGLLGPNGAGKTSTLRMMIGITRPDSGEVRFFGEPYRREHLDRIGYLPEERGLYKRMKVEEHLALFGQVRGMSTAEAHRRACEWCERLKIAESLQKKVEELSKGMQQKIQFIAALLHEPDFIIMDEPFSGLDPSNTVLMKEVLLDLKRAGRTILFSTHQMEQVERLCDSICLIDHGKAVLQGELRKVKAGYRKPSVQIEYEGDGTFLADKSLVHSFQENGNSVEVHLAAGADEQDLLRAASNRARVRRFALMEPSLEEIFIQVVEGGSAN
ncbi:MAG: ATP-binding cassette domain-containing protein [Acidobacteriales bacterium]|nr:ATP-binding cassette domain-containing protein [Terriglobales bacterium]